MLLRPYNGIIKTACKQNTVTVIPMKYPKNQITASCAV